MDKLIEVMKSVGGCNSIDDVDEYLYCYMTTKRSTVIATMMQRELYKALLNVISAVAFVDSSFKKEAQVLCDFREFITTVYPNDNIMIYDFILTIELVEVLNNPDFIEFAIKMKYEKGRY